MKTMADVERDVVADRIIAILNILLNAGWQINSPYGTVGGTVLHQAVSFWTGSYRWDLELRAAVTSFLCSRGADPFLANKDGKTANDVAVKEGHQDLVRILNQRLGSKEMDSGAVELVELPGQSVKADVTVRGADKR
jgi:ankyrin repeat protein